MIYEYMVCVLRCDEMPSTLEGWLNARGRDGWELVSVNIVADTKFNLVADTKLNQFIFKRPKVSQSAGAVVDVTSLADRFRTLREIADDAERTIAKIETIEQSP